MKPKRKADLPTRERLVRVAGRLFGERGFDGVSVRDIVAAAKVNLGAITYHFGSKEALFGEVVARKIAPLREMGERIAASKRRPDKKLRALLEAYAFYVMHEEPSLKVYFAETLAGGDRLPAVAVEAVEWRNRTFTEIVEDGIRAGIFRPCDVEQAAWQFFGMLSPYILYEPLQGKGRRHRAYSRAYVKRVVESAWDLFMNGIRRPVRRAARGPRPPHAA